MALNSSTIFPRMLVYRRIPFFTPSLFDPAIRPPLSTTDLRLCNNVSNSLPEVEVGVLCFRQKTQASLLSSGWV